MKKVKGGHGTFCHCACSDGSAAWDYTAKGEPNTPLQPSAATITNDLQSECNGAGGSCSGCTNY